MKKTLKLMNHYLRVLKEQGEEGMEGTEEFDTSGGEEMDGVTDMAEPVEDEMMPLSSEGENQYIADLIDAAMYEPTSDDARVLQNLQSVMKMKRFKNAREEILPTILNIIRPSTEESDIRDGLDDIN
jgi:hypothetical protein